MNRLKSVLEQRSKDWDPRVRRRLFSWRMFLIILLVVSVLSIGNVLMLEKLLKMEVFSVVASMGVGSYWVAEQGYQNLTWVQTGCVIAAHSGPGSFGIVGFSK